jgi:hypothetical protein
VAAYRFKLKGQVTVFVYEISFYTPKTGIIRSRESYRVTHTKISIYCKLEVAEMILEDSLAPLVLAS